MVLFNMNLFIGKNILIVFSINYSNLHIIPMYFYCSEEILIGFRLLPVSFK